ncbi:hypothetical protein PO909_000375 [Leuciscus waleckii]
MINGKECYRSDRVAEDIIKRSQTNEYKLVDKVPSPTQILQKNYYITLYNNQTRNAAWVYEKLNKSTLQNNVDKRTDFIQDASVHPLFQPSTNTYSGTGYDRGHLAAAGNHRWCQRALDDTYLLSNVIPQQHDFNCGTWNDLEEYCREIAKEDKVRNVHVYTGPLYLSSDSEKHVKYEFVGGKAVPTHLFKVIIVENNDGKVLAPECYKMKQFHLEPYKVKIEDIQRDSGLIFEETEIKEEITDETWKVKWRNEDWIEVKVSGSHTDHSDRAVLH